MSEHATPNQLNYDYFLARLEATPEPKPIELFTELGKAAWALSRENRQDLLNEGANNAKN